MRGVKALNNYKILSQKGAILGTSFFLVFFILSSCSILYTRPVQEMSDASAALKAARDVQADTMTPELYRQASDWFFRAKQEYKFKNFKQAYEYAEKARNFAERAEFETIRHNGGDNNANVPPPPPPTPAVSEPPAPEPIPTDSPPGTPADNSDLDASPSPLP
jgi:hypothetical protein